uniref:Uncharacterized protein n=1 Tax=Arundo donax TaxID=35708 RepID=A0A0A8YAT6_ARUDO
MHLFCGECTSEFRTRPYCPLSAWIICQLIDAGSLLEMQNGMSNMQIMLILSFNDHNFSRHLLKHVKYAGHVSFATSLRQSFSTSSY